MTSNWVMYGVELGPKKECWIINYRAPDPGGIKLRPAFVGSKCPECNRIDLFKELRGGIPEDVVIPKGAPDYFSTDDSIYVASSKTKEVLESVASGTVEFVPIPSSPSHWVVIPMNVLFPPTGLHLYPNPNNLDPDPSESFRALMPPPCQTCGRYIHVSWQYQCFDIPESAMLIGVTSFHPSQSVSIVVSDDVRESLKDAKLKGFQFEKVTPVPRTEEDVLHWWGNVSVGRLAGIRKLVPYLKNRDLAPLALRYLGKKKPSRRQRRYESCSQAKMNASAKKPPKLSRCLVWSESIE